MAWLTTPEVEGGPSRVYEVETAGVVPTLPLDGVLDGLFKATEQAGLYSRSDTGIHPISWSELRHWAAATDAVLTPSEFKDVKIMSELYVAAVGEFKNQVLPPPWAECFTEEETKLMAEAASKQMDKLMGM